MNGLPLALAIGQSKFFLDQLMECRYGTWPREISSFPLQGTYQQYVAWQFRIDILTYSQRVRISRSNAGIWNRTKSLDITMGIYLLYIHLLCIQPWISSLLEEGTP